MSKKKLSSLLKFEMKDLNVNGSDINHILIEGTNKMLTLSLNENHFDDKEEPKFWMVIERENTFGDYEEIDTIAFTFIKDLDLDLILSKLK